ncbi:hypothetical protein [Nonomuraea sp. NPDC050783]|uniref:hypothetical protein n=1 Tax=Nonomuraea sp. NPDC050783 TaxID=3154634 RepID=UPI0034660DC5
MTDRAAEVKYRLVVDGRAGALRTAQLQPGVRSKLGDFWYTNARASGSGVVRVEILNHNRPANQAAYSWTCAPADPSATPVRVSELRPQAYYGDCAEAPYLGAHARLSAPAGTEITYRWVVDGAVLGQYTHTVPDSGVLALQSSNWSRPARTDGTVRIEVLTQNKPSAEAVYPVHCGG